MKVENILDAIGAINDEAVQDARAYKRTNYSKIAKWGMLVACLCLIAVIVIPKIINNHIDDQPQIPIQRPIAAYIQDDVSSVEVSHYYSNEVSTWIVDGAELDVLREWTNGLQYEIKNFDNNATPDKAEDSEVFSISISEGDYPGFSYIIDNSGIHYLLIEGYWYSVTNPSYPPLTDKQ